MRSLLVFFILSLWASSAIAEERLVTKRVFSCPITSGKALHEDMSTFGMTNTPDELENSLTALRLMKELNCNETSTSVVEAVVPFATYEAEKDGSYYIFIIYIKLPLRDEEDA